MINRLIGLMVNRIDVVLVSINVCADQWKQETEKLSVLVLEQSEDEWSSGKFDHI
jgi:hypothetical protein